MTSTTESPSNQALTPLDGTHRVFGWTQHASLWFSLGVGLLVMQVGAYLVPAAGTREALFAIIAGSLIGSGLLAWVARAGCESGLSSAGLIHATYGHSFSRLPVLLNIVQLLGWTTFELVIMREGTVNILVKALGPGFGGVAAYVAATVFWGLVLTALLAGSMITLVRAIISRAALPLVVLSLLWLSWQFAGKLHADSLATIWNRRGDGTMGMFSALDLVIAMPVSWLPLVADYARHGKSGRGALGGTWLGYTLANAWCYALGMLVVSVAQPGTDLVSALLLAQGGLVALGLILVDELDNAYGDVYSGSVCAHSIEPRWSIRRWGLTLALASTLLALVLPMHSLEPFLLLLSSVFVPLYGVILGRLGLTQPSLTTHGPKIDKVAAALWLLGIAVYHGLAQWAPAAGSALPTLALTFTLAALTRPTGRLAAAG
ncbi:MAG TPA: cytosine permease [Burkholderiaceae bacterium]|nr:cytosine permease [Burkholderiaceae bacterium]